MLMVEERLELEGELSFDCKNPIITIAATSHLHHSSIHCIFCYITLGECQQCHFSHVQCEGEIAFSFYEALKQF